ncbi:hypothetical protein TNCV_4684161 [Trichonephila clavipes]|nr:hypothetical protein TNCV_4684161 [Trichonephila clavipes]
MWSCIILLVEGNWQALMIGHNHWAKVLEMYRSAFKLPSIRTRNVSIVYPIIVQTITLGAGPLCRYQMQTSDEQSSPSPQARIRPSEYCTQNRDSSEKTTL